MEKTIKTTFDIPDYPCKKEYKARHYWVLLGIIERDNVVYKIFECSKCMEAVWVRVDFRYEL